jgi:hypothetical protein
MHGEPMLAHAGAVGSRRLHVCCGAADGAGRRQAGQPGISLALIWVMGDPLRFDPYPRPVFLMEPENLIIETTVGARVSAQ